MVVQKSDGPNNTDHVFIFCSCNVLIMYSFGFCINNVFSIREFGVACKTGQTGTGYFLPMFENTHTHRACIN